MKHVYLKNNENGDVYDFWYVREGETNIVASTTTPFGNIRQEDPETLAIPTGYSKIYQQEYDETVMQQKAAELAEFQAKYDAAKKRDSLLDKLLGGIL